MSLSVAWSLLSLLTWFSSRYQQLTGDSRFWSLLYRQGKRIRFNDTWRMNILLFYVYVADILLQRAILCWTTIKLNLLRCFVFFFYVKYRCVHARVLHLHVFILILSHVCIYNKEYQNFSLWQFLD